MESDWVEELFIKHADLFQVVLEERLGQAEGDARGLAALFDASGVGKELPLLDLNCGVGRHAVHLANLGYYVVGVDISPHFVGRAKELAQEHKVADRTEFLVLDARRVEEGLSGRKFSAVISMYTSLGYYDEETDISMLRQCRSLTHSGGLFVFDTGFRDCILRHFQPSRVHRLRNLVLLEENEFDLCTSRVESTWTFLEDTGEGCRFRARIHLSYRLYCLHELVRLFEGTGWRYKGAYRDFELREPSIDGGRLVVVGQAC